MSKEARSLILMLGLPFAAAALLLAAGVVFWALRPVPAHADGASLAGKDGFAITTIDVGSGVQYLCVSTYAPYIGGGKGELRQFLTFYEIKPAGPGKAELFFVGSRCVDFDRGFAEMGFKSAKGFSPIEIQKLHEKELERQAKAGEPSRPANEPPRSNGG